MVKNKKKVLTLEHKGQANSSKSDKSENDALEKQPATVASDDEKSCAELIGMNEVQVKELQEKTHAIENQLQANDEMDSSEDEEEGTTSNPSVKEKVKVKRKDFKIKPEKREKQFIPLDDTVKERKPRKPKNKYLENRGIVLLRNIPHGFYEKQMQAYFSQFGIVTNLKLNRSKRSGNSKGTAFIEFQYEDVAKIVCETMHNYLMFNSILKCHLLDKETNGFRLFRNKIDPLRPPMKVANQRIVALHNARIGTKKTHDSKAEKTKKRMNRFNKKMESLGIDYRIEMS